MTVSAQKQHGHEGSGYMDRTTRTQCTVDMVMLSLTVLSMMCVRRSYQKVAVRTGLTLQ